MSAIPMSSQDPPRRRLLWDAAAELFSGRPREAPIRAERAEPVVATAAPWEAGLLDSLPDPVLVIVGTSPADPTGWRFVAANRAARETLRIVRDDAALVTVLRDPAVLEAVGRSLFEDRVGETSYKTAAAHERTWLVLTRPLSAGEAQSDRFALLIMRDETDVLASDRTRADFLANASHELRTPLASLLGYIETLRGHARADPVAREKFLGIMQAQAERMSRLIDDLMSLSRIELNEHIPPAGGADVAQVALDVLDALSPLAGDRKVALAPDLPALGQALVVGDRDQIVQVVQNLIDNALKYSRAGGQVTVKVCADAPAPEPAPTRQEGRARFWILSPEHAPAQRFVTLRVTDAGPGLAREHLPRLAERFYRVEGQKSGERAGTGLGLAIAKHIVNRHHGALLVESTQGEGSAFTVFLPRKPAESLS